METTVWHSGPPPEIGWWEVRFVMHKHEPKRYSWWNGERWSLLCCEEDSKKSVGMLASYPAFEVEFIEWTERWWV